MYLGLMPGVDVRTRMKGNFLGRGSDCLAGCEPSYNFGEKVTLQCGIVLLTRIKNVPRLLLQHINIICVSW